MFLIERESESNKATMVRKGKEVYILVGVAVMVVTERDRDDDGRFGR